MHSGSLIFKTLQWYGTNAQHRGNYRVLDALRRIFKADINEELVVRRDGLLWSLNPSDFIQQDVFWSGTKDMWDVLHLREMLSPGTLLVDIGSNFGYYALYFAHKLGLGAQAIAFEPVPGNFERLTKNVSLNHLEGRVKAMQMALSDKQGTAFMNARAGNSGSAQLQAGDSGTAVELVALDQIWDQVAGVGRKCDFIKIDVEGHEISVLRGAKRVIETSRPIILLEVDPPRLAESGSSAAELQDFLDGMGYRYFSAVRKRLVETTLVTAAKLTNTFCLHSQMHDAIIRKWVGSEEGPGVK